MPQPDDECPACAGCGKVADKGGAPWKHWEALPDEGKGSVRSGQVKPVACPACGGTGTKKAGG